LVIMHNRLEKDRDLDIVADIRRSFDRSLALAAEADIPAEAHHSRSPGIGICQVVAPRTSR